MKTRVFTLAGGAWRGGEKPRAAVADGGWGRRAQVGAPAGTPASACPAFSPRDAFLLGSAMRPAGKDRHPSGWAAGRYGRWRWRRPMGRAVWQRGVLVWCGATAGQKRCAAPVLGPATEQSPLVAHMCMGARWRLPGIGAAASAPHVRHVAVSHRDGFAAH